MQKIIIHVWIVTIIELMMVPARARLDGEGFKFHRAELDTIRKKRTVAYRG